MKPVQKNILTSFIGVLWLGLVFSASAQGLEEFNGPFKSWADIKTRFGAKGNGRDNDTKAFQKAIDELSNLANNFNTGKNAYTVLYIPAGTYIISSTLVMRGKIGVSIIGEDPANTIIKWDGADADTMFWANGSAYYKIARMTWDPNKRKDMIGIGIFWKKIWKEANSESFASVNIEISDHIFLGSFSYAINGGTTVSEGTNANDSEIAIRRCTFYNCTDAGINMKGYNALDYWIWDCKFFSCNIGICCNYGNYHAYRCYFKKSRISDVFHRNGYYTSVRGCYSEDSRALSVDDFNSTNPFKRTFQGNTVIKPTDIPVKYFHWGKISFWDNNFDLSTDTAIHMFLHTGSWGGGAYEVLSLNNTYRNKVPVKFSSGPNKFYSYNDKFVSTLSVSAQVFMQSQDKMPSKVNRTVYDVPENATETIIQQIINTAAKEKGKWPIVHFPPGKYTIHKPLVIPPGQDIQLIGDGLLFSSMIVTANDFPENKPMLSITGPIAGIAIKDLQLGRFDTGKKSINAIEFINVDQSGSQAFIDQLYTNAQLALSAEDIDYLYIQKDNSFFSAGNYISGGKLVQSGTGTAKFGFFCSQFAGLTVDKNAKAIVKDCWWEGEERRPLKFSGKGNITIDGVMIAPNRADSNTTISVNDFSGKICLLNMYTQGGIDVQAANPALSLLLWNIHFYHTLDPLKFVTAKSTYKMAAMGLTTQCFTGEKKCENIFVVKDGFKNVPDLKTFVPDMLKDDREAMPRKYVRSGSGTNIYISRVSVGDCKKAIRFSRQL